MWQMKCIFRLCSLAVVIALCSCSSTRNAKTAENVISGQNGEYSENTFIAHYDASVGKAPLLSAAKKMGCTVLYEYGIINAVAFKIPEKGKKIESVISEIGKVKGVIGVSRDRIMHLNENKI